MNGKCFRVFRARSRLLKCESVKLQKQVYCIEKKFEEEKDQTSDCFDEYDKNNQTQRVVVAAGDEVIATSRVILPKKGKPIPAVELQPSLTEKLDGCSYVEGSGFCCSKERRQQKGITDAKSCKKITLLLIVAIAAMAQEAEATHVVMVIETTFFRILKRLGIPLCPVGDPVEYHGTRQVYLGNIEEILSGIRRKDEKFWKQTIRGRRIECILEKPNEPLAA